MTLDRIFRFIGLIVFAIIGWQTGIIITQSPNPLNDLNALKYTVPLSLLGALLGWVIAPWLTTRPASAAIRTVRQIPVEDVVAGAIGLALGLLLAALLAVPLTQLPEPFGSILPFVGSIIFGYLGAMVAVLRGGDIVRLLARTRRGGISSGTAKSRDFRAAGPRPLLLDTSVIIDGRIADVAKTGFLAGPLLVPRFVLNELQYIADSPDQLRRARGRRGLEVLDELQSLDSPILEIVDLDTPKAKDVDEKLVILAREHDFAIMTNDYNLNRVAALQGLTVLNLNEMANAMKAIYLPGETLRLRIIQEGKEPGQGVGYLDDGTMVVVENGEALIGREVDLTVTKVLQTSAGRMIFAVPSTDK
ncbi:MAG: TRAM domain-containing protein [Caldilineae bacterium]|nr:MAG: TRAM domain-containing protein [Caldilineae bacterium]